MADRQEVIVVTGSSGFIGSALIDELAGQYRLVGFDRETSPHPPSAAECICIDLTSDSSLEAALQNSLVNEAEKICRQSGNLGAITANARKRSGNAHLAWARRFRSVLLCVFEREETEIAEDPAPRARYGEAFWRAHHDPWKRSDLNQREYCKAQGLSLKAFGNWRAKFTIGAAAQLTPPGHPKSQR